MARRPTYLFWMLLLGCVLTIGCDRKTDDPAAKATDAAQTPPVVLRGLTVEPSPKMPPGEWSPKTEEARARVAAALDAAPSITLKEAADGEDSEVLVRYGSQTLKLPNTPQQQLFGATVALTTDKEKGRAPATFYERIHAETESDDLTDEERRELLLAQIDAAIAGLIDDTQVERAETPAQFIALLGREELLGREATDRAIQKLMESVEETPETRATLKPILMRHLEREDPKVIVAAGGAMTNLGIEDRAPALIEAATKMNGANRLPAYVALLYMLGDTDEPTAKQYLETVATGHADPSLQKVAKEALGAEESP